MELGKCKQDIDGARNVRSYLNDVVMESCNIFVSAYPAPAQQ